MQKLMIILTLTILSFNVLKAQNEKLTISGTVYNEITNKPLAGVYITNGSRGCQTDRKGVFEFKNLPKGKITLYTMYYSTFSSDSIQVNLEKDTVVNFKIKEISQRLDEVVVTGTRTRKRLSETPILTNLVHANEIKKAGSVSTLETLQDNIPGIVVSPNAMGNNMRIKGLNSRYILFLVDGERMVSEGAGGNINLNQIDVDNIKKIEIVDGASSALYGSNAVGAVINIISKEPVHKFQAGAHLTFQKYNTWTRKINVGTKLNKLQAYASVFNNSSDGYDIKDGAYAAKYNNWGSNLKLKYKLNKKTDFNITGRYFTHETFNPENSIDVMHSLNEKYTIGGALNSSFGKHSIKASVNYDLFYDFSVLEMKNDENDEKSHASYTSTRLLDNYKISDDFELVSGLEYNHEEYFSKKILGSKPKTEILDDYNIFTQGTYKAFKGFDIVGGLRYTYNNKYKSAFSPKLSLMYKIDEWTFRGGVGSAFRAPSIKELFYNFSHNGAFQVLGNADLKAEKGMYYSLSSEFTKGSFNASISAYYNKISDKITQYYVVKKNALDEYRYKNVSSATLKGFNINLSYILLHQFIIKGNYSYCDAIDNSTGLQLSSNVKHSGTISTTWNSTIANSPFSLQMSGRIHSAKLYQSSEIDSSGKEIITKDESKPYSIWKLAFSKPIRIQKHTIELSLKCDNIFNFKEESFVNPGRQFLVGIRYNFK